MSERGRSGVGHAGHLEHRRDMGVTALALNPVGHVEYDSRRLAVGGRRHKLLELRQKCFVSLQNGDLMTAVGKSIRNHLYGSIAVLLGRDLPKTVDNPAAFAIAHDCNSHTRIPPVKSVARARPSLLGSAATAIVPSARQCTA